MKNKKLIAIVLILVIVLTIVGMVIDNAAYWLSYNYVIMIIALIGAISLLKK